MPKARARHFLYWLIPCLIYGWAVLHSPHRDGKDLLPTPDAIDYALLATRLAHFEAPLVQLGLWDFPSRYPMAYPILLAPFAWVFSVNQLWIASAIMGLIATALMARAGRRLLGSRLAGGLAACFWALHPNTLAMAGLNMSEMGLMLAWLCMLEAARPWIDRSRPAPTLARAALAGLALAWLGIAKAPFWYWGPLIGALMFAKGRRRDLAAFVSVVIACLAAHLLYQRWAFGAWGVNGYTYHSPAVYHAFWRIFNPAYMFTGWRGSIIPGSVPPPGNLEFYGRQVLGLTHDFYAPYMAVVVIASFICVVWPRRAGRPGWLVVALLGGWGIVGFLFCALYHFQATRFLFIWIPLADLLAAWGLVHVPLWRPFRKIRIARLRLKTAGHVAAFIVALFLLRGEWRRDRAMFFESPDGGRPALADVIPCVLKQVPAGQWLISNFELPLMPFYRPSPGPTAALYSSPIDYGLLNGHAFEQYDLVLKPHRVNATQSSFIKPIPIEWLEGSTVLINPSGHWQITAGERRRLFEGKPVWLLMVRPKPHIPSDTYLRDKIWPMVQSQAQCKLVAQMDDVRLFRMTWKIPAGVPDQSYD
ncbi:hypothetical protein LLG95_01520 [bacterium]|nr:hypothetical protein [bacterium]